MTEDYDLFCYDERGPFSEFDKCGRICVRLHEPTRIEKIENIRYIDTYTWGDVLDYTPHYKDCDIIGELVILKNLYKGKTLMRYGKIIIITSISNKVFTREEKAEWWEEISKRKPRNYKFMLDDDNVYEEKEKWMLTWTSSIQK